MNRLLSDEGVKQLYATLPRYDITDGERKLRIAFEDEHANTLKATAEWQIGKCGHGTRGAKTRSACALCQTDFNVALRKGELPREETP